MNYSRILIAIAVMALVTYLIRMLPLVIFRREIKNRFLQSFLYYIPYTVLAAMTIPEILHSTATLWSALIGLGAALFLAYKKFSLLIVALGSVVIVFLSELLFSLFGFISF